MRVSVRQQEWKILSLHNQFSLNNFSVYCRFNLQRKCFNQIYLHLHLATKYMTFHSKQNRKKKKIHCKRFSYSPKPIFQWLIFNKEVRKFFRKLSYHSFTCGYCRLKMKWTCLELIAWVETVDADQSAYIAVLITHHYASGYIRFYCCWFNFVYFSFVFIFAMHAYENIRLHIKTGTHTLSPIKFVGWTILERDEWLFLQRK